MNNLISLVLLISSLFYFFSYPEVDNDLWGHLFFGREFVEKGKLPLQNFYSYTAPDHVWINHEWFAEVIFYGFFHFFGSPGLILLKVALGAGVIWMLDLTIRKRVSSLFVRTIILVWAMAILSPGFNIRPQIFTYFFFAIFLFLFYRSEEKGGISFYWLILLTALWVNLHGGFVAGLGAIFAMDRNYERTRVRDQRANYTPSRYPFGPLYRSLSSKSLWVRLAQVPSRRPSSQPPYYRMGADPSSGFFIALV